MQHIGSALYGNSPSCNIYLFYLYGLSVWEYQELHTLSIVTASFLEMKRKQIESPPYVLKLILICCGHRF